MSPLQSLAAQWKMLNLMAGAFAQRLVHRGIRNPQRAVQEAEALEVWCQSAGVMLFVQIQAQECAATSSKEDRDALTHLRQMVYAVQALLFVLGRIKARLMVACRRPPEMGLPHAAFMAGEAPVFGDPLLDPG